MKGLLNKNKNDFFSSFFSQFLFVLLLGPLRIGDTFGQYILLDDVGKKAWCGYSKVLTLSYLPRFAYIYGIFLLRHDVLFSDFLRAAMIMPGDLRGFQLSFGYVSKVVGFITSISYVSSLNQSRFLLFFYRSGSCRKIKMAAQSGSVRKWCDCLSAIYGAIWVNLSSQSYSVQLLTWLPSRSAYQLLSNGCYVGSSVIIRESGPSSSKFAILIVLVDICYDWSFWTSICSQSRDYDLAYLFEQPSFKDWAMITYLLTLLQSKHWSCFAIWCTVDCLFEFRGSWVELWYLLDPFFPVLKN